MITETNINTKIDDSQEVTTNQPSYEEQLAASLMTKNVALAQERGIPLWMLTGFPTTSDEPDEDDPVDFL